jgi:hypothetical protein
MRSAYDAAHGPIRAPLVPTFVADALDRHVAVMLARSKLKLMTANDWLFAFPFAGRLRQI